MPKTSYEVETDDAIYDVDADSEDEARAKVRAHLAKSAAPAPTPAARPPVVPAPAPEDDGEPLDEPTSLGARPSLSQRSGMRSAAPPPPPPAVVTPATPGPMDDLIAAATRPVRRIVEGVKEVGREAVPAVRAGAGSLKELLSSLPTPSVPDWAKGTVDAIVDPVVRSAKSMVPSGATMRQMAGIGPAISSGVDAVTDVLGKPREGATNRVRPDKPLYAGGGIKEKPHKTWDDSLLGRTPLTSWITKPTELPTKPVRPGVPLYAGEQPEDAAPTTEPAGPALWDAIKPIQKWSDLIKENFTGPMITEPARMGAEHLGTAMRGAGYRRAGNIAEGLGKVVADVAGDPAMIAAALATEGGALSGPLGRAAMEATGVGFGVPALNHLASKAVPDMVADYETATPEERDRLEQRLVESIGQTALAVPGLVHGTKLANKIPEMIKGADVATEAVLSGRRPWRGPGNVPKDLGAGTSTPAKPASAADFAFNPKEDPFDALTAEALGNPIDAPKPTPAAVTVGPWRPAPDPIGDFVDEVRASAPNVAAGAGGSYEPVTVAAPAPAAEPVAVPATATAPRTAPAPAGPNSVLENPFDDTRSAAQYEPAPWADLLKGLLDNPAEGGARFAQQLQQAQSRGGHGPLIDALDSMLPVTSQGVMAGPRRGLKAIPGGTTEGAASAPGTAPAPGAPLRLRDVETLFPDLYDQISKNTEKAMWSSDRGLKQETVASNKALMAEAQRRLDAQRAADAAPATGDAGHVPPPGQAGPARMPGPLEGTAVPPQGMSGMSFADRVRAKREAAARPAPVPDPRWAPEQTAAEPPAPALVAPRDVPAPDLAQNRPGEVPPNVVERPAGPPPPATAEPAPATAVPVPESTVPEAPETIEIQLDKLAKGERGAVMIPKGQPIPARPKGVGRVDVSGGDAPATWFFDKNRYTGTIIQERATTPLGRGNLLGKPPKPTDPKTPVAVATTRTPEGVETEATVVTFGNAPAVLQDQTARAAAAGQGETVKLETPDEVTGKREAAGRTLKDIDRDIIAAAREYQQAQAQNLEFRPAQEKLAALKKERDAFTGAAAPSFADRQKMKRGEIPVPAPPPAATTEAPWGPAEEPAAPQPPPTEAGKASTPGAPAPLKSPQAEGGEVSFAERQKEKRREREEATSRLTSAMREAGFPEDRIRAAAAFANPIFELGVKQGRPLNDVLVTVADKIDPTGKLKQTEEILRGKGPVPRRLPQHIKGDERATEAKALAAEIDWRYKTRRLKGVEDLEARLAELTQDLEDSGDYELGTDRLPGDRLDHPLRDKSGRLLVQEGDPTGDGLEAGLEEHLAQVYDEYLHRDGSRYGGRGDAIENMRESIAIEQDKGLYPAGDESTAAPLNPRRPGDVGPSTISDEQILAIAKDAYEQRAGIIGKLKAGGPKPGEPARVMGRLAEIQERRGGRRLQEEKGQAKGAYTPADRVIELVQGKADISTVAHEVGHYFHEVLLDHDDWGKTIKDIYGDLSDTKGAERFARHFEGYLRTGKAPIDSLKSVFEAMRQWMQGIYEKFKYGEAPKEVKAIFDKVYEKPSEETLRLVEEFDSLGKGGEASAPAAPAPAAAPDPGPVGPSGFKMADLEHAAGTLGIKLPSRESFKESEAQLRGRAEMDFEKLSRNLLAAGRQQGDAKDAPKLRQDLDRAQAYVAMTHLRHLTDTVMPALTEKIDAARAKGDAGAADVKSAQAEMAAALSQVDGMTKLLYESGSEAGRRLAFQKAVFPDGGGPGSDLDAASAIKRGMALTNGKLSKETQKYIIERVEAGKRYDAKIRERLKEEVAAARERMDAAKPEEWAEAVKKFKPEDLGKCK